jgi:hypothetical protein
MGLLGLVGLAVAVPGLGEELRAFVDAADSLRQSVTGGERRGGSGDCRRHERDGRIEPQERNAK